MKLHIFIAGTVIALGVLAAVFDLYSGPQMVPVERSGGVEAQNYKPVPDFIFTDIQDKTHRVADFRGSVVLLNFWATWCAPCVRELPAMARLIDEMDGRVKMVALSSDRSEEDIEGFLEKLKAQKGADLGDLSNLFVAWDKNAQITHGVFMTTRYPETIIVAPDGRMVRKIVGEIDWEGAEIKAYLRGLYAETD